MSSDVSRASQIHHVPHIGFPHNEPDKSAINVNHAPKGALSATIISANFIRQIKLTAAANAMHA